MVGEVPGQHVVPAGQRRAELLEHVGRLAAAVQADHRREPGVAPLQVVHLAVAQQHEAAAAAGRDVVARGKFSSG